MRELSKTTEPLDCALTFDEQIERGKSLALVCQDIEREATRQQQIKADMKANLTRLEAEQARLTLIVQRAAEPREVQTITYADDESGQALTIRPDTGEIIRRRSLTMEERQPNLPDLEDVDLGRASEGESAVTYARRRLRDISSGDEVQG